MQPIITKKVGFRSAQPNLQLKMDTAILPMQVLYIGDIRDQSPR